MIRPILLSFLLITVYSSARQVGRLDDVSPNTKKDACKNSRGCARLADSFIKRRNDSVDPCENFYQYACGNKATVKPLSQRKSQEYKILDQVRELLEKQPDKTDSKAVSIEKQLYKTCLDSAPSLPEEKRKFVSLLESTGGLSAISTKPVPGFSKSWQESDKIYTRLGFKSAFFDIKRKDMEADKNMLVISPPTWRRKATTRISKIYEFDIISWSSIIDEVIKANPPSSNDAIVDFRSRIPLDTMLKFGEELDNIVEEVEDNKDLLFSKNKMSINEWQREYDETKTSADQAQIHWLDVLKNVVSLADIDIDESEPVAVVAKESFKKLAQVLEKTPKDVITSYVHLNLIYDLYQLASGYGAKIPLWRLCISFSDLVGVWHEFIVHHKLQANRELAGQMNDKIKTYIFNEARNNWVDESKKTEIDMIEKLRAVIGYPEWMHNPSIIDSYYDGLEVTTSVYNNLINMAQFNKKRDFMKLRKPETPERYSGHLLFNDMSGMILENNQIVYSTEFLMKSFYGLFDAKYPRGVNFGALGSEFGMFWWNFLHREGAEALDSKYVENKKCFEKQWDDDEVTDKENMDKDTFVQGVMVANSVQSTFNAYKTRSDDSNKLPGLEDLTDEQLFFLSFANNVCATGLEDDMKLSINHIFSNMEEFSTVYKCPKNSAMNKQNKCYKA